MDKVKVDVVPFNKDLNIRYSFTKKELGRAFKNWAKESGTNDEAEESHLYADKLLEYLRDIQINDS